MDWSDEAAVEAWLHTLPRDVSVAFAARAALRLTPLALNLRLFPELSLLILRCGLTVAVAGPSPSPEIREAAQAQAEEMRALSRAAAANAAEAVNAAARTAHASAARAAARMASATMAAAADAPANAAAAAAFPANIPATAEAMDHDAARISQGARKAGALFAAPLWPERTLPKPIAKGWQGFTRAAGEARWQFWIAWYQSILDGRLMDWTFQHEVALIDPDLWEGEAAALTARLAEIEAATIK